jgi:hypothetical protein
MTLSYDKSNPDEGDMTVNTQFAFSEGHIRLLIWMCDTQADFIERAVDDILEQGDKPSDNMLNCREGIADLKCWALRLLEALEEEYDEDEEVGDDEEDELFDPETDVGELEAFRDYLKTEWQANRRAGRPKRRTPLQGLRAWLRKIL